MLEKRSALTATIKTLWDRIGQRKGINVDLDMNLNLDPNEAEDNTKIEIGGEEEQVFEDQTEIYRKN